MRRWSVRSVLFQGCLDRVGGGGLAQAGEDPSDAVLVADGIDITLSPEVLGRIDKIVAPGTTPNPFDSAYVNPALTAASLRR
jgi:hypothetical protein